MTPVNGAAISACYTLAGPELTPKLVARTRQQTLDLLGRPALVPPALVEEVLSSGDRELLTTLARSAYHRPALFDRMAAMGDPGLAMALYGVDHVDGRPSGEQRKKIWQGAWATADDPGWRAPDGLVAWLLEREYMPSMSELSSPFPELVRAALKQNGRVSPLEKLYACRNALKAGGVPALQSVAESRALGFAVSRRVQEACASAEPETVLDAAIREFEAIGEKAAERRAEAESQPVERQPEAEHDRTGRTANAPGARTASGPSAALDPADRNPEDRDPEDRNAADGDPAARPGPDTAADPSSPVHLPAPLEQLVTKLRDTSPTVRLPQRPPGALNWKALLAMHREKPFSAAGLRWLWQWPGCPEELAVAAFAARPWLAANGPLYAPMLTLADFADDEAALRTFVQNGIATGVFPVDRVLGEATPARRILNVLPYSDERMRTALAAQVARLGADFAEWRAAYTLLPRFDGSVTALVDAALAEAPKHRGQGWPKPLKPEFPHRTAPPLGRTAWLHLFDRAGTATQYALTAHMDGRTIQYLLLQHDPAPELWAHLAQTRGASVLAGCAASWHTAREKIEKLIAYDDPEINAALFLCCNLTDAERRHILSGRRWKAADGAMAGAEDRLPLTARLVVGLEGSARRTWLLPVCDSGDPLLCRILLGNPRVKVHTDAQNLLMLVRLWERHGPDEVRALLDETDFPGRKRGKHPLPPHLLATAREALDAPDGLAVLRRAQAEATGPAGLAGLLKMSGWGPEGGESGKALAMWEDEVGPAAMPWQELLTAHRTDPLPLHDQLLVELAELPGCPPELVEAAVDAGLRYSHSRASRRSARPPTPGELLRKHPLPVYTDGTGPWVTRACEAGRLTLPEVLEHGFPARACASVLGWLFASQDGDGAREEAGEEGGTGSQHGIGPASREGSDAPDIGGQVREVRAVLADLAQTHLGDDPEGWALVLSLMPDFEGTLPELLTTAGAVLS